MKRKHLVLDPLLAVLFVLPGCSASVPDEWKDLTPTENLDKVVDAATTAENLVVVYEKTDADAIRAGFRKLTEAKGLTLVYECKYPDGRLKDGYLKSPDSVQWTIMPPEAGEDRIMVMASKANNTADFLALPDETGFCVWVNR